MSFAWPLFALALLLPLLVRLRWPWRLNRSTADAPASNPLPPHRALNHPGFPLLRGHAGRPLWQVALIWVALITALCRPQWLRDPLISYQPSRDLWLAVDLSDSMRTLDMLDEGAQRDRLSVVRQQTEQLIRARRGDRLGLIVFADHAYLLSPLTDEQQALLTLSRELDFDLAGRMTALGEAIELARQHADFARPSALLLITDGRNTAGSVDPLAAARLAAAAGLRIYTVGVGAEPGALPQPDEERGAALHDPSSELDEPLLRQIAELGQGRYFRARTLHDVTAINDAINILEPSATPLVQGQPVVELYPWPLALAWLLMVLPRFASERLARAVRQGWSRWR